MAMPFDTILLHNCGRVCYVWCGKLAIRPDSLAPYIASLQTWSSEIAVLLQVQPTPTFALGGVEFELAPQ